MNQPWICWSCLISPSNSLKMKTSFVFQILLVSLFACASMGEENPSSKGKIVDGSKSGRFDQNRTPAALHRGKRPPNDEQIELLHFLLEASPDRLRAMRKTIERVEKMTFEERKSMRVRLKRFRENPPADRTKMMRDYRMRQDLLLKYWNTLDPETRAREMKHFYQLPLPQRPKYLEKVRRNHRAGEGKKPKGKEAITD